MKEQIESTEKEAEVVEQEISPSLAKQAMEHSEWLLKLEDFYRED